MLSLKKVTLCVAGAALALGSLTLVTTTAADAAVPCAAENQAAGQALVREGNAEHLATKAAKRLKKAKKNNRKHHTTASKRKLKQARRINKRAQRRARIAKSNYAAASAAADKCQAPAVSGAYADPSTVLSPADVTSQLTSGLEGMGVPADVANQVAAALAGALGGNVTQGQMSDLLAQLQPILGPLAASGIPIDASTVEKAIAALSGSGLPTGSLSDIINSLLSSLTGAGIPANDISAAIQSVLSQLAAGAGTDPSKLVPSLITTVESVLSQLTLGTGIDLAALNSTLSTLTPALTAVLSSTTGPSDALSALEPLLDPVFHGIGL